MTARPNEFRPQGSVHDLAIGLTVNDVAALPGYGKTTFDLPDAHPLADATTVQPDFVARGLRRVMEYYVLGMHAAYGLSNFAEPVPFLLLLRRLADDIYAGIRAATEAPSLLDASPGNAEYQAVVRALYPEAFAGAEHTRAAATEHANAPAPAPPVIVVGCPRSGTTWLQRMLQSHPALAGPDGETCLFTSVRQILANPSLQSEPGRDAVVRAMRSFADGLCAHWQATHAPGARRLVEKTPSNVDHLDAIAEIYPEASIIGIYRDGRDVVRSMLAVPFAPDDPVPATRGWVDSVRKMQRFAAHSDQIRVVRYEAIRADPVGEVAALLTWLGLPTGDDVRATLATAAGTQVSQHRQSEAALSPRATRTVYRLGGDLLVDLGYASERDVRAARLRPGSVLDVARRGVAQLMRHR